jgi:DNA-binding MarR family transcriptional regulator
VGSQPGQDRPGSPERDTLDSELTDAFSELVEQMIERFEDVGRRFSLPPFCVKALHMLSSPMAMKELGRRFHCDPSFVTSIADMLDSRGLGRRETDTKDRRIKNLTLTPAGIKMRALLEREMISVMPWTRALDESERETLLRLVRKMIKAAQDQPQAGAGQADASSAQPESTGSPRATTGGTRAGEVSRAPSPAAHGGS